MIRRPTLFLHGYPQSEDMRDSLYIQRALLAAASAQTQTDETANTKKNGTQASTPEAPKKTTSMTQRPRGKGKIAKAAARCKAAEVAVSAVGVSSALGVVGLRVFFIAEGLRLCRFQREGTGYSV